MLTKEQAKIGAERLAAVANGGALQDGCHDGSWVDWDKDTETQLAWLCSGLCRIKPTPKTVPLSLETWPEGLVMVRGKESGCLFTLSDVRAGGVVFACEPQIRYQFQHIARHYTRPDGTPLTRVVEE